MIGYLVIAVVAGYAGWIYAKLKSQGIEDELRFQNSTLRDDVRILRKLSEEKEQSCKQ